MVKKADSGKRILSVAVVGMKKEVVERVLPLYGLRLDRRNPDVVISFGGDGTSLLAEKKYPGRPRLLIRHSKICKTCTHHDFSHALLCFSRRKFHIIEEDKLDVSAGKLKDTALNDVNIHYVPPTALRFELFVNGKKAKGYGRHETYNPGSIIGDGIVVSTPHGSSGYFHSITRKTLKSGIGIAFNNPVKPIRPLLLNRSARIKVLIERGPGVLAVDNHKPVRLNSGNTIMIRASAKKARRVVLH